MVFVQQDVARLHIAVHDSVSVGVRQRLRYLRGDAEGLVDPELGVSLETSLQGLPGDVRHDVVEQPTRLAGLEQRQDVGVLQLRFDLDLAEKPVGGNRSP